MVIKPSRLYLLLFLLLLSDIAQASLSLALNPGTQTGNAIAVEVIISGLGDGIAPSLSTYDFDIGFDYSHLMFSGAVFGAQLDVLNSNSNYTVAEVIASGVLNLAELSLDSSGDLDAWQTDSFTLATLSFDVLRNASSEMTITPTVLGDGNGDPLLLTTLPQATTITTVPVPSAVWLMVSGLGLLLRVRK
jgi:hypothetical protein